MPSPKKPSHNSRNSVKIIGGEWRGRKLPVAELEGLRPTGNRIRETLFNWLRKDIASARCLDLYAGTGVLGLEALSRGARYVQFVEQHPLATKQLASNMQILNAANATLTHADALTWLADCSGEQFNIVFVDPPFASNLWSATFDALTSANCLTTEALIYLETPADHIQPTPSSWALIKEKTSGQVSYRLYRVVNS